MKKREEYFLNTIRHWKSLEGDHLFGIGSPPAPFSEMGREARYLVTHRWTLTHDDNDNIIHSRRALVAMKRRKEGRTFTKLCPKRILELLKMAAFPEIIE